MYIIILFIPVHLSYFSNFTRFSFVFYNIYMATAVRPCSFYPPPTEDQTRVNPTETLQYEYQIFLQNYKKNPDGLRRQLYTQGSELGRLMSSSSPNCSRTFFYYSLFAIVRVDQSGSIQRIQTCAQNGVNGHPDSASPVDAAIRCYSILVSNLYQSGKGELAEIVCDFLHLCTFKTPT